MMKEQSETPKHFFKQLMEEAIPLHKFLGIELLEMKKGYGKVRVPFREEVVGDIRRRRWHGGIIATVMDSVGGFAAGTYLTSFEDKIATVDMRVDYLWGATESAIVVDGTVIRAGSTMVVTTMRAWQEGSEELLAEGKAVSNIRRQGEQAIMESHANRVISS